MRKLCGVFSLFILVSCGGVKHATITDNDYLQGKETSNEVFVITNDGVKHSGTKIKFPPRYFQTSEYIEIDGTRYNNKKKSDILAYQTESEYRVYMPGLNEHILRIRKGKINLYYYYNYDHTPNADGRMSVTSFLRFIIEKQKNLLQYISYDILENAFSDNAAVLQKYHELYPDKKSADKLFTKNNHLSRYEYETLNNLKLLVEMYNGN
ncbi:MAG: hypothetical protein WDM90_00585 [Ferruginibacter sp.]